jgi:cell division GTPase FtsZ
MKTNKQIKQNIANKYSLTLAEVQEALESVATKAGYESNVFNGKVLEEVLKLKTASNA